MKHISYSLVQTMDVEAEAGSGGSGTFSVEAEARKIHRFHIEGKNGEKRNWFCYPS